MSRSAREGKCARWKISRFDRPIFEIYIVYRAASGLTPPSQRKPFSPFAVARG